MKSLSSYIIYSIIFILSVASLLTIYRVQTTYACLDNLQKVKNLIISSALSLNASHSNMKIVLEFPSSYEYQIYYKNGEIYIKDLKCNVEDKIDVNLTLVEQIVSKEKVYLVKNFSVIYLSPYDIVNLSSIDGPKKDGVDYNLLVSSVAKSPSSYVYSYINRYYNYYQTSYMIIGVNIPKIPMDYVPYANGKKKGKIYFLFVRSAPEGGWVIPDFMLDWIASSHVNKLIDIYTSTLTDLEIFNDTFSYEYRVIYDYFQASYDDLYKNPDKFFGSMKVFESICKKITNNDTPFGIVFVFLKGYEPGKGGFALSAIDAKKIRDKLLSFSKCFTEYPDGSIGYPRIAAIIYITIDGITASVTLAHEAGHAIGRLADQYINGCVDYLFDVEGGKGIIRRFYYGVLKCNYLSKDLGAKINPKYYSQYVSDLYKLANNNYITKDELDRIIDNICSGESTFLTIYQEDVGLLGQLFGWLFGKKPRTIVAVINITNPNEPYINLEKECNVLYVEKYGNNMGITNCRDFFKNLGEDFIYTIYLQYKTLDKTGIVPICEPNIDIFGHRDIMGVSSDIKYFSKTSIEAFKYNVFRIW